MKCERCNAKAEELFEYGNQSVCADCIPADVRATYIRWSPKLQKEVQK